MMLVYEMPFFVGKVWSVIRLYCQMWIYIWANGVKGVKYKNWVLSDMILKVEYVKSAYLNSLPFISIYHVSNLNFNKSDRTI